MMQLYSTHQPQLLRHVAKPAQIIGTTCSWASFHCCEWVCIDQAVLGFCCNRSHICRYCVCDWCNPLYAGYVQALIIAPHVSYTVLHRLVGCCFMSLALMPVQGEFLTDCLRAWGLHALGVLQECYQHFQHSTGQFYLSWVGDLIRYKGTNHLSWEKLKFSEHPAPRFGLFCMLWGLGRVILSPTSEFQRQDLILVESQLDAKGYNETMCGACT